MSSIGKAQPANYYAGFSVQTFGQGKFAKVAGFAKACFQALANLGILLYNLARFRETNNYRPATPHVITLPPANVDANFGANDGISEADIARVTQQ